MSVGWSCAIQRVGHKQIKRVSDLLELVVMQEVPQLEAMSYLVQGRLHDARSEQVEARSSLAKALEDYPSNL